MLCKEQAPAALQQFLSRTPVRRQRSRTRFSPRLGSFGTTDRGSTSPLHVPCKGLVKTALPALPLASMQHAPRHAATWSCGRRARASRLVNTQSSPVYVSAGCPPGARARCRHHGADAHACASRRAPTSASRRRRAQTLPCRPSRPRALPWAHRRARRCAGRRFCGLGRGACARGSASGAGARGCGCGRGGVRRGPLPGSPARPGPACDRPRARTRAACPGPARRPTAQSDAKIRVSVMYVLTCKLTS